jgi:hypothetical protein
LIPAPDLTFDYVLGILGILTIIIPATLIIWKYGESDLGVVGVYGGMAVGFTLIILGLNGSVGLGDFTDGKIDLWKDQITEEIYTTECQDLRLLSLEYKKSNIGKYTIGQIEDEIREQFVYNCVDTREQWWIGND